MKRPGRPLYARLLRLRHLKLRPYLAFLFFEGSVGLGVLLALADITTWLAVIVVPATVAVMVKINDIVAGGLGQAPVPALAGPAPATVSIPRTRPAPIRGASARRTREIVGRARLGTARGIVYVHPTPGSLRRPRVPGARTEPDDAPPTKDTGSQPPLGESPSGDTARDRPDRNKGRFAD